MGRVFFVCVWVESRFLVLMKKRKALTFSDHHHHKLNRKSATNVKHPSRGKEENKTRTYS